MQHILFIILSFSLLCARAAEGKISLEVLDVTGLSSADVNRELEATMAGTKERMVAHLRMASVLEEEESYEAAIPHYQEALAIGEEFDNVQVLRNCYAGLGANFFRIGQAEESLVWTEANLNLSRELEDAEDTVRQQFNLAMVYHNLDRQGNALQEAEEALRAAQAGGFRDYELILLTLVANIYLILDLEETALPFALDAVALADTVSREEVLTYPYEMAAAISLKMLDFESADRYIGQALDTANATSSNFEQVDALTTLVKIRLAQERLEEAQATLDRADALHEGLDGQPFGGQLGLLRGMLLFQQENYPEAIEQLLPAIEVHQAENDKPGLEESLEILHQSYHALGDDSAAYAALLHYVEVREENHRLAMEQRFAHFQLQYDTARKDREIAQLEAREQTSRAENEALRRHQEVLRLQRVGGVSLLGLAGLSAGLFFRRYRDQQRARKESERAHQNLASVYERLWKSSDQIQASIAYAQRIQSAMLPSLQRLSGIFGTYGHCLLFRPRDVVSGDFFWTHETVRYRFAAVVDCTGHGVPGAFMSMIGLSLLDQILVSEGLEDPAAVLECMDERLRRALERGNEGDESRDGMDIILARIDKSTGQVSCAGARRPLFLVAETDPKQPLRPQVKPVRRTIGGSSRERQRKFFTESVSCRPGDWIYLTSDGFFDAPGEDGYGYPMSRFENLLLSMRGIDGAQRTQILAQELDRWQMDRPARDDVTILGLRVPDAAKPDTVEI